ncbi:MAG TPA: AraC family transcriptional regulator [Firmicutes bacterium]|nr:AraC family transcriptional regulator [Bacillota bacterium]
MEDLKSQVSFLRGLASGLDVSNETKEGKLLLKIIDVLANISQVVDSLGKSYEELIEYMEAIDQDLTDLEDDYYEGLEDEDEFEDEPDDDETEEDNYFTVECPDCKEVVYLDEDLLEEDDTLEVLCPKCERVVFVNDKHFDEGEEEENND